MIQMQEIINILHIASRTDRKQLYMEQLADFGLIYKVWDAIENKETPFIGINKSHKLLVRYAKEKGDKQIFITEDDYKFTCPASFKYFIENEPKEYDLYLGGVSGGVVNEKTNEVQNFSGLFFYKVNECFYDAFLSAPDNVQIDRWLGLKGLETIEKILGRKPVYKLCYPMPVICYDGYSDNSKKHMEHKNYFAAYKQLK